MAQHARTLSSILMVVTIIVVQTTITSHFLLPVRASDLTFATVKNLSNDPFSSDTPEMTTVGINVYITWQNSTLTTNNDIVFTASHDNGTTFGTTINLSNSLPRGNSVEQQVAASGSYVYVVWKDNTTGTDNIFFIASNNAGSDFSFVPLTNLAAISPSSPTRQSDGPQIAVSGTNVYVVWYEVVSGSGTPHDVFLALSSNNGQAFTVSNLSGDKTAQYPAISASGSNVYVAWQDASNGGNVFLRASNNGGGTFGAAQNLSNFSPGSGITGNFPQIGATGIYVYVAWVRDTTLTDDVYFSLSINSGASFGPAVNLSQDSNSYNPALATSGSSVYVVWADKTTSPNILVKFRASNNNGASFASTITLSSSTGFSQSPQIAAGGSNVYIAWQDRNAAGNLFFTSSSDSGATFGGAVNLSQDSNSQTVTPAMAANGNKVYVAWQDDSGQTNPDILFRTNSSKVNFTLYALFAGWNSTSPGSVNPCSPSATSNCNPALTRFKGRPFTIQIIWRDSVQHDIAVYTNGTAPGSVLPSDNCSLANTAGCLAKTSAVTSSSTTALLTFTPTVPSQDFTGIGGYEYYCQYHPSSMRGHIRIYKSPDIDGNGVVNILDISIAAFAYGSTAGPPPSSTWNIAADLDNNGRVDILDVAFAAYYFEKPI